MRACWLKWVGRDWSISADYIWLNYSGANTDPRCLSRLEAMALTWSFESLETPIFSATLCTLRVLVPVAYISATAATRARSTRRWRSITSSGKKLPERSFGMRSVSVPAQVRATSRGSRFGCSPRHRSAGRPRRPSRRSRPVWRVWGAAPACRWRRR